MKKMLFRVFIFILVLNFSANAYLLKDTDLTEYSFILNITPANAVKKAQVYLLNKTGSEKYVPNKLYSFKIYKDQKPDVFIDFNNKEYENKNIILTKKNDTINLKLTKKKVMNAELKKIIDLLAESINSSLNYYETKNIESFKEVSFKLGEIFNYENAFKNNDFKSPVVLEQIRKEFLDKLSLSNDKIDIIVKRGTSLLINSYNIYLDLKSKSKDKKLTIEQKQILVKKMTTLWWDIFDIIKTFRN